MNIVYVNRNGKVYAYTSTSHRVPGRDNPISDMRYIGIYNPSTGLITPKKIHPDEVKNNVMDGRFESLDGGSMILCESIATRIGIIDALKTAFGDEYETVLFLAMVFAANPNPSNDVSSAISVFHYNHGIKGPWSREKIQEVSSVIGRGMWKYYCALKRSERTYFFERSGSDYRMENISARDVCSDLDLSFYPTFYVTDNSGRFLILGSAVGLYDRDSALTLAMDRMREISKKTTVVIQWAPGVNKTIIKMLLSNRDIIVFSNNTMQIVDKLMHRQQSSKWTDASSCMFKGQEYLVKQHKIGVVKAGGSWIYVDEEDPNYSSRTYELNAFLWKDPEEGSLVIRELNNYFDRKMDEMNNVADDRIDDVIKGGSYESFFIDFSKKEDGSYDFKFKKRILDYIMQGAGVHCFITTTCNWHDCMMAKWIDNRLHHHIMPIENIYRWSNGKESSFDDRYLQLFIRCISIDIRMHMEDVLEENGMEETVDDVFRAVSSYRIVTVGNTEYKSAINSRARNFFKLFDVNFENGNP